MPAINPDRNGPSSVPQPNPLTGSWTQLESNTLQIGTPQARPGLAPLDWTLAIGCGVLALTGYLLTVCPTIGPGDSAELTRAAAVLGIAHAPGYPLLTWLARLAVAATRVESALAVNLLNALLAAAAVSTIFLVARGLMLGRAAAAGASLGFAFSLLWWQEATCFEVYTLEILLLGLLLLLLSRPDPRRILAAGFLLGLACAHRPTTLLWVPALAVLMLSQRPVGKLWRAVLAVLPLFVLGLSASIGILLRARLQPPVNWNDPATLTRFWELISAAQYRSLSFAVPLPELLTRVGRLPAEWLSSLGLPALLAALAGTITLVLKRRLLLAALLLLLGTALFGLTYAIPDYSSQLLPATVAIALLAGFGIDWLTSALRRAKKPAAILLALVVGGYPLVANIGSALENRTTIVRDLGHNILSTVPVDGVVIYGNDAIGNPARYAAGLERTVDERVYVNAEFLFSPIYWRDLQRQLDLPDHESAMKACARANREEAKQRLLSLVIGSSGSKRSVFVSAALLTDRFIDGPVGEAWNIVPAGLLYQLVPKDEPLLRDEFLMEVDRLWSSYRLESTRRAYRRDAFQEIQIAYAAGHANLAMMTHRLDWYDAAVRHIEAALAIPVPPDLKARLETDRARILDE